MALFKLRAIADSDRAWVAQVATEQWGADLMIAHGERYYISQLPGYITEAADESSADLPSIDASSVSRPLGLVTYRISGDECEITSLNSFREGIGIGAALIHEVQAAAAAAGCRRLFLITTNDNINALRFYQKRGFVLCALRPGAVNKARKLKPEIPLLGENGIPIRDEIELEMLLNKDK